MKSRDDFKSKEEYETYLITYFSGLAMQGFCSNPDVYDEAPLNVSSRATLMAISLIDQLKKNKNL